MTGRELWIALGDIHPKYYEEAETGTFPARKPLRRPLLIAALVAMMLLLVGCAVYVLRLQDLKIDELSVTHPAHYGPDWVVIEAEEKTYEILSVQGFLDSSYQQATKEWREYLDTIADGTSGMLTPEKQKKLEEITEKYGLKPITEEIYLNIGQSHILLDALQLSEICLKQDYAQTEYQSGSFCPEGSFQLWVTIFPDEESWDWPYAIYADFQYYRKGYFQYDYVSVENLTEFQEWEYRMPDNGTALLALGEENALILAERETGMFCIRLDSRMGIDTMTQRDLERIADLFDFSIVPQSLSYEETKAVKAEIQQLDEQAHQQMLQYQAEYEESLKKEGFAGWVKETLNGQQEEAVRDLGYAFYDIDGNGTDDLLIGRDGYCTAIYWEVDGQVQQFSNAAAMLYPCENQIVGYTLVPWGTEYWFTKLHNESSMGVAHISYVQGHPEGEYRAYDMDHWNKYDNISKEAFDGIFQSYVRVPISFLPLTEYPLNEEPAPYTGSEPIASAQSYADWIRNRLTSAEEQWPRWKYDIRDLNHDGIEEMIWSEDGRIWLYTMTNEGIISYNMISDGSMIPCEYGIVQAVHHYGPVNKTYRYYKLVGDQAVLVDYLRYDVDADPENPWRRSPDLTGQDITLVPISEMEAMSILASYEPLEMELKPISEYPFE